VPCGGACVRAGVRDAWLALRLVSHPSAQWRRLVSRARLRGSRGSDAKTVVCTTDSDAWDTAMMSIITA
jgi:hypothetical protein